MDLPSQIGISVGAFPKMQYCGQVRWNPQERETARGLTRCVTAAACKPRIRLVVGPYRERVEFSGFQREVHEICRSVAALSWHDGTQQSVRRCNR
jgi:hypothetical protein